MKAGWFTTAHIVLWWLAGWVTASGPAIWENGHPRARLCHPGRRPGAFAAVSVHRVPHTVIVGALPNRSGP